MVRYRKCEKSKEERLCRGKGNAHAYGHGDVVDDVHQRRGQRPRRLCAEMVGRHGEREGEDDAAKEHVQAVQPNHGIVVMRLDLTSKGTRRKSGGYKSIIF